MLRHPEAGTDHFILDTTTAEFPRELIAGHHDIGLAA
jgi:hypothetical protein